jgi:hypothetical protein
MTKNQELEINNLVSELCMKTGISTTKFFDGINDADDVINYLKIVIEQLPIKRY